MRRAALVVALLAAAGPAAGQGPRLYVANQDDATVSVVDLDTRRVVETLDLKALGFGPNAKPHHAQVEPDGSAWYLTAIGAGKVLKFDRANRIVGQIDQEVPGLITLVPGTDLMVIARSMSAVNPPRRLTVIRRSDFTVVDEIEVFFPRPHALVAHPGGKVVYTASLGVNQFAAVRLEDGHSELIDFEGGPQTFTQFAVSPDGRWLAVTAEQANQVLVYDLAAPGKPVFARAIPMAKGPFEPVFSYDGTRMFVTNLGANRVSVVSVPGWAVTAEIESEGFGQPHGVGLSPDGSYLWVSNRHQAGGAHDHEGHKATATGTLVGICIPTGKAEVVLPVGHYAAGIGVAVPAVPPKTPPRCS